MAVGRGSIVRHSSLVLSFQPRPPVHGGRPGAAVFDTSSLVPLVQAAAATTGPRRSAGRQISPLITRLTRHSRGQPVTTVAAGPQRSAGGSRVRHSPLVLLFPLVTLIAATRKLLHHLDKIMSMLWCHAMCFYHVMCLYQDLTFYAST